MVEYSNVILLIRHRIQNIEQKNEQLKINKHKKLLYRKTAT